MGGYAAYLLVVGLQERRRIRTGDEGADEQGDAAPDSRLPWWLTSALKLGEGLAGVLLGANLVVNHGV